MSTSGVNTWDLQSTALVTAAYRKVGYLSEGQVLSSTALANGVEQLNAVLFMLETMGMPLWKRTSTPVTLVAGTSSYNLTGLVKLAEVYVKQIASGTQWKLQEKSLYDFNNLPTLSTGYPVHYTYQPSLADGSFSVWPTPDSSAASAYSLLAVYQKKFDGMINATDTVDFPSYWLYGIEFQLALALAPETGLALPDRSFLQAQADKAIKMAQDYGDEDGSILIMPERM